jgi:hypothetical protein
MWIQAEYYPGTNDSTHTDHGYTWTPAIDGGYYTYVRWVGVWNIDGTFSLRKQGTSQVWYPGAGPPLKDPYNPPEIPIPEVVPLECRIYINGVSQPLLDNFYSTTSILGIVAPLTIGPKQ